MNLLRIGRAASGFVALRLKLLGYFTAFTLGWLACFAWVLVLHYAPQVAVSIIEKVH